MNTKYSVAFIAMILTSLTAFGADKLSVIFPDTTNLVFTVPISGNTGERPYDAFLEHPLEYEEDGRPIKYERIGLGYYISIEVIEETGMGVRCKLKIDHCSLSELIPYTIRELILLQPTITSFSTETELTLPIGEWFSFGGIESHRVQFLFERIESQQSGAGYPPQGVGSPDP